MKIRRIVFAAAVLTMALALNAENLITPPASVYLDTAPGVKCVQDKEQNTQKLLIEKYTQDKEGNLKITASLYYGTAPGDKYSGRGILAEPETTYKISFEYQGDVPRFWSAALDLTGDSFWKDRKRLKTVMLKPKSDEWQKAEFEVTTGKESKRLSFFVNLYVNEKDKTFDLKPGQTLTIRNASVEKK